MQNDDVEEDEGTFFGNKNSDLIDFAPDVVDFAPQHFHFSLRGSSMGPSYEIDWIPSIRALRIQGTNGPLDSAEMFCQVSDAQWKVFWFVLDKLQVWDWQRDYGIKSTDGTSWDLDVINGSRRVRSEGRNRYPGGDPEQQPNGPFSVLLAAIHILSRRNDAV